MDKTEIPFRYAIDFPYFNSPTSNEHISLIQTQNCTNLAALEILFQDFSYHLWKQTNSSWYRIYGCLKLMKNPT